MKKLFIQLFLCGTVVHLATEAGAQYTRVPPEEITASAQNAFSGRPAQNAVGTLGLNLATDEHGVDQNTMWMGLNPGTDYARWFRADLGSTQNLARIKIWNFNMNNGTSFSYRGVKDIEIFSATDPAAGVGTPDFANTTIWSPITATTVANAGGVNLYKGEAPIDFMPREARWVGIRIINIHQTADQGGYGGLSKVQFFSFDNTGGVLVNSQVAADVGSTFATLPADVMQISGSGALSVWYGEDEHDDSGWSSAQYPSAVSVPGVYGITVSGLKCGVPLFFRHVVELGGGEAFTSGVTRAFTPYINVASSAATIVGLASAHLPGAVTLVAGDSGKLRVYYDTVNHGATTNFWAFHADSGPVAASDALSIPVSGLTTGQEYWYRHAFVTAAGDVCLAPASFSFTPEIVPASLAATGLGATSAVLPANLPFNPDDPGTLRVYYGAADGGGTTNGWTHHEDFAGTVAAGVNGIAVGGLTLGQTYWFRHAYVVSGAGAGGDDLFAFAPASLSFTTVDDSEPTMLRPDNASWPALWSASQWINMENRTRVTPGVAGDTLNIRASPRVHNAFQLDEDTKAGHIIIGWSDNNDGGWYGLHPAPGAVERKTITFDSGVAGTPATVTHYWLGNFEIGQFNGVTHDLLGIHLASPLVYTKDRDGNGRLSLHAPITGGEEPAEPVSLTFNVISTDWNWFRVFMCNTNSTFRGDIVAGLPGGRAFRLQVGAREDGRPVAFVADDRMLGDPSNRVILRHGVYFIAHNPAGSFTFRREFIGTGMMRSVNLNQWYVENDDGPTTMNFTDSAVLSPGEPASFGRLDLWGGNMNFSTGATVRVKLAPPEQGGTVNDFLGIYSRLNNVSNSNSTGVVTPGVVTLDGKLEITETARIREGSRWTIARTAYPGIALNGKFREVTRPFKVTHELDGAGIWHINVEKLPSSTMVIVR